MQSTINSCWRRWRSKAMNSQPCNHSSIDTKKITSDIGKSIWEKLLNSSTTLLVGSSDPSDIWECMTSKGVTCGHNFSTLKWTKRSNLSRLNDLWNFHRVDENIFVDKHIWYYQWWANLKSNHELKSQKNLLTKWLKPLAQRTAKGLQNRAAQLNLLTKG